MPAGSGQYAYASLGRTAPGIPLLQVLLWGYPNTPAPGVAKGLLRAERVGSPKGLWALAQIMELKG